MLRRGDICMQILRTVEFFEICCAFDVGLALTARRKAHSKIYLLKKSCDGGIIKEKAFGGIMKRVYIKDGWTLSGDGFEGKIEARVPGCVHTDLVRAGYIANPLYRDNNEACRFIERGNYVYSTRFIAKRADGVKLVFEGLDTYADIYLNGIYIGESHNMFIPHEYPVSDALADGENCLEVRFRSPINEVEGLPKRAGAFTTERMYSRRMQCTYSWDWVERFVTMGIFLPVYLVYPSGVYASGAYVYTTEVDSYGAEIVTELEFSDFESGGEVAFVEIISPWGKRVAGCEFYADRERFVRRFNIKNPDLWWPVGYGEQPLYTLRVTVGENVYTEEFGIRTLRIVEDVDEVGSEYHELAEKMQKTLHGSVFGHNERHSGFLLLVNGTPIFCKGGNWVPCEPFPSEESDKKITKLVKMAKEIGANMLRVWGGGYFERDSFYDACDREGILVLQDFLMACGEYPEKEEWFIDELRLEAEFAARKLRNHPSLAWWHGDNENATAGSDVQENYTGRQSALSGLCEAVTRLDHTRRFLPSSPYGGNTYGSVTVGTTHSTNFLGSIFDYFDKGDLLDYKEYLGTMTARFISEEGVFGGISTPSLLRFMTAEDLFDESEAMLLYHTKGNPALEKEIFEYVTTYAKKVLGEPKDLAEKLFKYRYAQFEWVRLAFENAHRNIGYNNGILFWMFNDCWPAALGWSFVDYYLMPKASYYAFRRFSSPLTASLTLEDGEYTLTVSAEGRGVGDVEYKAYVFDKADMKEPLATLTGYIGDVAERSSLKEVLPVSFDENSVIYVDVEGEGGCDRCFYRHGHLTLTRSDMLDYSIDGDEITLIARGCIHAVEIEAGLVPTDNYFTLLPGEKRTVRLGMPLGEAAEYPVTVDGYTHI